jgi:Double zinc ribbon
MTLPCLLFDSSTKENTRMAFDKNVAAASAGSINAKAGASTEREIDLYDELIHFAELPREQQRQSVAPPEKKSAERTAEPHQAEPVPTPVPITPVEAETARPIVDAVYDSEDSHAPSEPSEVRPELSDRLSPSGPLRGLTGDLVFSGVLSGGVCRTCGAESAADDLFCITCGGFIDEIAAALPNKPTCGECGVDIASNEIFCPWCGAVLPA